jgi:tRNA (guanine26-N2/guanine27-N2)-dimethyltransferase
MKYIICLFIVQFTTCCSGLYTVLLPPCDSFHLQPLARTVNKNNSVRHAPGYGPVVPQECSDCGKKFNMVGPIWSAPIHDPDWVSSILSNVVALKSRYPAFDKIYVVLTSISEELQDVPLYVSLHSLCATLKCTSPSTVMFRSTIINAGYNISGTHANPLGLKTDAHNAHYLGYYVLLD